MQFTYKFHTVHEKLEIIYFLVLKRVSTKITYTCNEICTSTNIRISDIKSSFDER